MSTRREFLKFSGLVLVGATLAFSQRRDSEHQQESQDMFGGYQIGENIGDGIIKGLESVTVGDVLDADVKAILAGREAVNGWKTQVIQYLKVTGSKGESIIPVATGMKPNGVIDMSTIWALHENKLVAVNNRKPGDELVVIPLKEYQVDDETKVIAPEKCPANQISKQFMVIKTAGGDWEFVPPFARNVWLRIGRETQSKLSEGGLFSK